VAKLIERQGRDAKLVDWKEETPPIARSGPTSWP
jgi:hypothetical protein